MPRVGFGTPLSPEEWHCFRVRPSNHPRRRIAGAAGLLNRLLREGLVPGLSRVAQGGNPAELLSTLTVAGGTRQEGKLIGRGRAGDLAVNVVLPFLHGLASSSGQDTESQAYLNLYQRYGKLQENELTREMVRQLMDPSWWVAVTNARRQQGLLHLHSLVKGAH